MDYHIYYAGSCEKDHGLMVAKRPNIAPPKKRITVSEIPGREYDLSEESGSFEDVTIPITFNYVTEPDLWARVFRGAVLWLRQEGILQFSDDLDVFRKVRYVTIGENNRELKRLGIFTATFVCFPGEYLVSGRRFISISAGKVINSYSIARPIYEITGNGLCVLMVNGNTMEANVDGTLTIDTDKWIAYKTTLANTSVTGDYDDLYLIPGENDISVTKGFTVKIRPNWRVL